MGGDSVDHIYKHIYTNLGNFQVFLTILENFSFFKTFLGLKQYQRSQLKDIQFLKKVMSLCFRLSCLRDMNRFFVMSAMRHFH